MNGSVEDKGTIDYLRLIAEAGIESRQIDLEDIGLTGDGRFVDLEDRWIPHLFKLHAWRSIISNKGILPLLWEFNKGHPNLLAAQSGLAALILD